MDFGVFDGEGWGLVQEVHCLEGQLDSSCWGDCGMGYCCCW